MLRTVSDVATAYLAVALSGIMSRLKQEVTCLPCA